MKETLMRPISCLFATLVMSRFASLVCQTRLRHSLGRSTAQSSGLRHHRGKGSRNSRHALGGRVFRSVTCHAIILNLLVWPSPGITFGAIAAPLSGVVSTIGG